jgi:DNA mismatch endonuclease (patch repair protein)
MASVRKKDTLPETTFRKVLHGLGLRYRLHVHKLPGTPDIVLSRFKAVVFIHGCFWHRHVGCKAASTPKTNTEFWVRKFASNVQRDERKEDMLRDLGWQVFVVWGCEVSSSEKATYVARKIAQELLKTE